LQHKKERLPKNILLSDSKNILLSERLFLLEKATNETQDEAPEKKGKNNLFRRIKHY
jgi:hypothetical protein